MSFLGIFQLKADIITVSIVLGASIILMVRALFSMIEKKRIDIFVIFFILGTALCFSAGFMFYNFFDIALDLFYLISFVSTFWIMFSIWRGEHDN